jgi:uncharacterized protein with von Willebrand factor type A (vWA) domain
MPAERDTAGDLVREELVTFVRVLRAAGAEVPTNASLEAARALGVVGLDDRDRARAAVQAAVLTRVEDIEQFRRLFDRFWSRLDRTIDPTEQRPDEGEEDVDGGLDPMAEEPPSADERDDAAEADETLSETGSRYVDEESAGVGDEELQTARYSPVGESETVQTVPTGGDEGATEAAVGELTSALAAVAGRRWGPASSGRRPDVRQAIRQSVATGGLVTSVPETRPKRTEVRGAVFVDVSQSVLDVVDRTFLVAFLRAVSRTWRDARIFLFDTDVRETTAAFDADTTVEAYRALERAETTWGGGTRIGHALTTVRETDPDAVDRRSVALVISDGLEMGDVDELESGVAWLARRASRVLWLNPLAKSSRYEPTSAGMSAALPHLDGLFAFTGPDDISELARQLTQYDSTQLLGYQYQTAHP